MSTGIIKAVQAFLKLLQVFSRNDDIVAVRIDALFLKFKVLKTFSNATVNSFVSGIKRLHIMSRPIILSLNSHCGGDIQTSQQFMGV